VLERLGFSFQRSRGCTAQAWDTLNGETLNRLASIDLSSATKMFGAPVRTVHRVDLHAELLGLATTESQVGDFEHMGEPVKLRLSSQVVRASSDGEIFLQDGSKYSADLIVAADGVHSVFRDVVMDTKALSKPRPSGLAAFRFLIETEIMQQNPVLSPLLETQKGNVTMIIDTKSEKERQMMWYACRGCVSCPRVTTLNIERVSLFLQILGND
jgi:salicylate hydroxylase